MDFDDDESGGFTAALPPALVSLTPFTNTSIPPSPRRRLSSCFAEPNKPIRAKRQLAWLSLQGRLVGAEEASSALTIDRKGIFSADEAAAWELFTPIQRVLVVAVVAAASMRLKKCGEIFKLQKSVQLRDQVLLSMQEKLDNLCEQVNYFKDQPQLVTATDVYASKRMDCGCMSCQYHNPPSNYVLDNTSAKGENGDEVFKYKASLPSVVEPEERRMSDLSDWAPSVTSSIDIQLDSLAIEHDIISLQRECEEKDVTIKKLSTFLQSSEVLGSKRITELEDIIRRKTMIIHKLRKDVLILEQKVMNLSRLRRPSFHAASSNAKPIPLLTDNVLYDMENTTSPSSSDSDTTPRNQIHCPASAIQAISVPFSKKLPRADQKQHDRSSTTSPLKERSLNQTPDSFPTMKLKDALTIGGENRSRRRPPVKARGATAAKRWV